MALSARAPRLLSGLRCCVQQMHEDIDVVLERDPSVHSRGEARLAPHLVALWAYRVAHLLYQSGHLVPARAVSLLGRGLSGGIEIHPGARIGRRLFIDHGCGTVIGETVVIGDDVTIYHQVTLGALGMHRDALRPAGETRHPQLGSRVVVGANAVILGPVRIGDGARIAATGFVTRDVPEGGLIAAARSDQPAPVRATGPPGQRGGEITGNGLLRQATDNH